MTREEKANIMGNALLARKEAKEALGLLQSRASGYADILTHAANALDAGNLCQHDDGRLSFGIRDGGIIRFGEPMEYPTPLQINEVLGEIQKQKKRLSEASAALAEVE